MIRKIGIFLVIALVAVVAAVVVLHLVAVAGICVFSSLKARSIAQQNAVSHSAKEAGAQPAADSGEFYTAAKGDTLAGIAKKLHVDFDDLLRLNAINGPKKLQIGRKLRVPAQRTAGETNVAKN